MAARSMFRGLAFVVFLSVVNPVWMVVSTDLSACEVEKISPQDPFLQDLKGTINFYVTGQTRQPFTNKTVSELLTFTRHKNGTLKGSMSVVYLKGDYTICANSSSVVTINKSMKRVEVVIVDNTKMHCYLINSNKQHGQFAWFCQVLVEGVPINKTKLFALCTVNPRSPPSPDMVKVAFGKMCSGLAFKSDLFDSYSVDTVMTEQCRFVLPALLFHSTSSAVQTMPSVFLSMTLSLLVLYL